MKFYVAFFFALIFQSLFIINASRLQKYGSNNYNVASFDELNESGASNGTKILDEQVDQVNFDDDEMFIDESNVGKQNVNAEINHPKIPTTPLPSAPKPTSSDPTSKSSLEWWGIVILVILALIIFGIVATFGFLCWKKRRSSKPAEETKPITVITDAKEPTTIQTASKTTRPDLNFTQFEPSKSQKKQQKAVTKEPTTTEEFILTPPPKVTVSSPPDLTKPFPKQPQYSIPQRVIPRSYKSLKTDSLEEDSEVVQEMKKNYPEVRRVPMQAEIVLFCVKISLMFTELHEMT
uniref:Uncharacterized protein n=1 Tax=Panagrolaimus sp. ES5 TaxID=591445 RepID=A0AC34G175_9BILA